MASRGQYLLRISGRIRPEPDRSLFLALSKQLQTLFGSAPGEGTAAFANRPGDDWPRGFLLKDYSVCQWNLSSLEEDRPYRPKHPEDRKDRWLNLPDERTIDFVAEAHHTLPGPLYFNRQTMLEEVRWFYHYRDYKWHADLVDRLMAFNKDYQKILLERIWFRDWKWYCGNGGC